MALQGLNILYPETEWPNWKVPSWRLWDIGVQWCHINPVKDRWDYSRLDAMVELGKSRGVDSFLLVLGSTPRWAASDPNAPHAAPWIGAGSNSRPKDMQTWREYVIHTVHRYKGVITHYQIWNEPQLADFYYPIKDIDYLAAMTSEAKRLMTLIDPCAQLVAAPVIPRPSGGGMRRASRYLRGLRDYGWPVDVMTTHIYPEIGKGPERWRWMLDKTRDGLTKVKAPKHAPLWITEANYNLLGGAIRQDFVAPYMSESDRLCDEFDVDRCYWYGYGSHSNPNAFGIPFTENSAGSRFLESLSQGEEG